MRFKNLNSFSLLLAALFLLGSPGSSWAQPVRAAGSLGQALVVGGGCESASEAPENQFVYGTRKYAAALKRSGWDVHGLFGGDESPGDRKRIQAATESAVAPFTRDEFMRALKSVAENPSPPSQLFIQINTHGKPTAEAPYTTQICLGDQTSMRLDDPEFLGLLEKIQKRTKIGIMIQSCYGARALPALAQYGCVMAQAPPNQVGFSRPVDAIAETALIADPPVSRLSMSDLHTVVASSGWSLPTLASQGLKQDSLGTLLGLSVGALSSRTRAMSGALAPTVSIGRRIEDEALSGLKELLSELRKDSRSLTASECARMKLLIGKPVSLDCGREKSLNQIQAIIAKLERLQPAVNEVAELEARSREQVGSWAYEARKERAAKARSELRRLEEELGVTAALVESLREAVASALTIRSMRGRSPGLALNACEAFVMARQAQGSSGRSLASEPTQ